MKVTLQNILLILFILLLSSANLIAQKKNDIWVNLDVTTPPTIKIKLGYWRYRNLGTQQFTIKITNQSNKNIRVKGQLIAVLTCGNEVSAGQFEEVIKPGESQGGENYLFASNAMTGATTKEDCLGVPVTYYEDFDPKKPWHSYNNISTLKLGSPTYTFEPTEAERKQQEEAEAKKEKQQEEEKQRQAAAETQRNQQIQQQTEATNQINKQNQNQTQKYINDALNNSANSMTKAMNINIAAIYATVPGAATDEQRQQIEQLKQQKKTINDQQVINGIVGTLGNIIKARDDRELAEKLAKRDAENADRQNRRVERERKEEIEADLNSKYLPVKRSKLQLLQLATFRRITLLNEILNQKNNTERNEILNELVQINYLIGLILDYSRTFVGLITKENVVNYFNDYDPQILKKDTLIKLPDLTFKKENDFLINPKKFIAEYNNMNPDPSASSAYMLIRYFWSDDPLSEKIYKKAYESIEKEKFDFGFKNLKAKKITKIKSEFEEYLNWIDRIPIFESKTSDKNKVVQNGLKNLLVTSFINELDLFESIQNKNIESLTPNILNYDTNWNKFNDEISSKYIYSLMTEDFTKSFGINGLAIQDVLKLYFDRYLKEVIVYNYNSTNEEQKELNFNKFMYNLMNYYTFVNRCANISFDNKLVNEFLPIKDYIEKYEKKSEVKEPNTLALIQPNLKNSNSSNSEKSNEPKNVTESSKVDALQKKQPNNSDKITKEDAVDFIRKVYLMNLIPDSVEENIIQRFYFKNVQFDGSNLSIYLNANVYRKKSNTSYDFDYEYIINLADVTLNGFKLVTAKDGGIVFKSTITDSEFKNGIPQKTVNNVSEFSIINFWGLGDYSEKSFKINNYDTRLLKAFEFLIKEFSVPQKEKF